MAMADLPFPAAPVASVHCPTRDEFAQRVARADEPFKVTGAIQHWQLLRALDRLGDPISQLDYLSCVLKGQRVAYTIAPPEQGGSFRLGEDLKENFSFNSTKTRFPGFADEVKAYLFEPGKGNLYLQSTPLDALGDQLGPLDMFEGFVPFGSPGFWIGSGRQKVGLHNDPARNIIGMFAGRKRVILLPPDDLPGVYPAPFDRTLGNVFCSLVDMWAPDLGRYPQLETMLGRARVAVLEPGEFVYLPPLWWHAVESEGFSIGFNCWFLDDGERNEIYHCYFPGRELLPALAGMELSRRAGLRAVFRAVFDTGTSTGAAPNGTDAALTRRLIAEARRHRESIESSGLEPAQQEIWRRWVHQFADRYVFCVDGVPFPTLGPDAHGEMVQRLGSNKISIGSVVSFVTEKLEAAYSKARPRPAHSIVPPKGRRAFRVGCESSVVVSLNGGGNRVVVSDGAIGGMFVRAADPPAVGSIVNVAVKATDDVEWSVRTRVAWVRDGAGYGVMFCDDRERVDAFLHKLQSTR